MTDGPREIWAEIFNRLRPRDLLTASQVNVEWREVARDPWLWNQWCRQSQQGCGELVICRNFYGGTTGMGPRGDLLQKCSKLEFIVNKGLLAHELAACLVYHGAVGDGDRLFENQRLFKSDPQKPVIPYFLKLRLTIGNCPVVKVVAKRDGKVREFWRAYDRYDTMWRFAISCFGCCVNEITLHDESGGRIPCISAVISKIIKPGDVVHMHEESTKVEVRVERPE
jgi:F-box-like